jgi:hypothetical protein
MDHLSDLNSKFYKRILIVWAIAILWIYVGNIINFHQHHIWGKQLIPVACSSSRSKEKSIIKYQGFNLFSNGCSPLISENSVPSAISVYGNFAAVHFSYSCQKVTTCTLLGRSLRAPPSV